MSKLLRTLMAITPALVMSAAPASANVLGPEAAACTSGNKPAVLARITGFKARTGMLRVQIYSGNPSEFLEKGKWLRRIELPVTPGGRMDVCVAVPAAGNYAVAVRHDLDGDGKSGWSDGGGFSRNPHLSLVNLKPKHSSVVISVGAKVTPTDIVLNYRSGLSIRPVSAVR